MSGRFRGVVSAVMLLLPLMAALPAQAISFRAAVAYPARFPRGIAAADLDRDGRVDLAVLRVGSVTLLYGNGDGTFSAPVELPVPQSVGGIAAADVSGDSAPDLLVSSEAADEVLVMLNRGGRAFGAANGYQGGFAPTAIAVADFDGNGSADMVVISLTGDGIGIMRNRGDGSFQGAALYGGGANARKIVALDLDGDGKQDAALANSAGSVTPYFGDGQGRFRIGPVHPAGASSGYLAAGDFDGDGRPDLATSDEVDGTLSLLRGNGSGSLLPAVPYPAGSRPAEVLAADVDRDGDTDLLYAGYGGNSLGILENDGDGRFRTPVQFPTGATGPRWLALGDFNGDGRVDAALAHESGTGIAVLINETPFPVPGVQELTLNPTSLTGGCGTAAGRVMLTLPAPAGGAVVALTTTPTMAVFPTSVTVPAGRQSLEFILTAAPVAILQSGTLTASYAGRSASVPLVVRPISITRLEIAPSRVVGGERATVQMALECPAPPGGLVVTLSSSHAAVRLPATVTVAAGASAASFTVTTEELAESVTATLIASSGGLTRTAILTVVPGPPRRAPAPLVATLVTSTQIRLTWNDNTVNETGFEIERQSGTAGFARLTTVGANTTVFTDTSLPPATTFSYRVRAVNSAGSSTYSNEAVATTPPPSTPVQRIAVFRPSTREWFLRNPDGSATVVSFGGPGDVPVPADYLGLGDSQVAVFRPESQEWFLRGVGGLTIPVRFPVPGATPVPADYLGLGRSQIALYRAGAGEWFLRQDDGRALLVPFGGPADVPTPADYLGLGRAQIAVFRPATGEWFVRTDAGGALMLPWGAAGDVPIPADYLGLGRAQIAVYRPSTAEFFLRDDLGRATRIALGTAGDVPVPGNYHGNGRAQFAVFHPGTAEWLVRADNGAVTRIPWGMASDVPVPAAFAPRFAVAAGER